MADGYLCKGIQFFEGLLLLDLTILNRSEILTDEVDCDGRHFGLGEGITDGLLLNIPLDMGVHHDAGHLGVLNHSLWVKRR